MTAPVNQLINLNSKYEKLFNNFAEKNWFKQGIWIRVWKLCSKKLSDFIAPVMYEQLSSNPQDKLDFYLPYIKPKYHETLRDELKNIKINDEKEFTILDIKLITEI